MSRSAVLRSVRRLRSLLAAQQDCEQSDEQLLAAFADRRDEIAFATLVRRHGPMVLGVCRRILGHVQDAEDAYQATFLVLARRVAAVRDKTAVGSFLHGVAHHLASKIKRAAGRRHKYEGQIPARPCINPADELMWREVRELLDEEIARLPEKYRSVFVLCCLEELSRAEAGQRLGLKERTVLSRLAEARKRLSQRLSRRGVELTAVLAAATLETQSASALPIALMAKTIQAASAMAVGEGLSVLVSDSVAELVQGGTPTMLVSKAKIATVLLLAITASSGAGMYFLAGPQRQPRHSVKSLRAGQESHTPLAKPSTADTVEIRGHVLAPDGEPKPGAKLLLLREQGKPAEIGVTAADGRFSIVAPKKKRHLHLLAVSDGAGLDFIDLGASDPQKPIELRLVKDNAIRGRILSTEGKPIRGVRVTVTRIDVYPNNSLETFLIRWQKRRGDRALPTGEKTARFRVPSLLTADTDEEGRFAIRGVGVERIAELEFQGGGIATTTMRTANRPGFDFKPYNRPADDPFRAAPNRQNPPPLGILLQGPNATILAEPEKPIRGTVTDADSGKGVANVSIRLEQEPTDEWRNFPTATTDAHGRYEFRGARKTKRYPFHIDSDSTAGYLPTQVTAADTVGFTPLTVDLRIKKGAIVTGKIIDRATGKSVPGFARFAVLINNPFIKDYPPFHSGILRKKDNTAADGTFRVAVIPGPVLLMGGYYPPPTEKFDYIEFSKYRPPIADPQYPEYFVKPPALPGSRADFVGFLLHPRGLAPIQGNYCKVLDIKLGTAVVHQDIFLDRASILEVKIRDPQGRPVAGVWATDFASHPYGGPLWIEESTCPVYGLESRKSRMLIFYEPKKKIIGSRKLTGDEKKPRTVTLGPMASLKGRLLDSDGKPLAGVAVNVRFHEREAGGLQHLIHDAKQSITDARGAFVLDDLIPEFKFELLFRHGKRNLERAVKPAEPAIRIDAGEFRDLGTIGLKPASE